MNEMIQSRLFMFLTNIVKALTVWFRKHPLWLITIILTVIVFRAYIQPEILYIRKHSFVVVFAIGLFFWFRYWIKRERLIPVLATAGIIGLIVVGIVNYDAKPHHLLTLLVQHKTLDLVELDQMPQTRNERIHPLISIKTMSSAVIADVEHVTDPNYVKFGDEYRWTIGIEPQFSIRRLISGSIKTVFAIPGQAPTLDFTGDHEDDVHFTTGEHMLFFKDASYLARQSFGLIKFFNYEPSDLKYIPGPDGELVQILTLTRWKGIFFPRPVFGGLIVFEQDHDGFAKGAFDILTRLFIGEGKFISASEIAKHDWLIGQNLMSYDVARHIGESFRFRRGILGPLPFYHRGDIEIPDLPGDMNEQPFTSYFDFDNDIHPDKLYHYFALEPYKKDRQGLTFSVLVPADNVGPTLFMDHEDDRMIGVTLLPTLVRDSKPWYDWSNSSVAEGRPFIRDIAGKRRYCFLSTVVSRQLSDSEEKDGSHNRQGAISGVKTKVTITDALIKDPIWIEDLNPDTWEQQIEEHMKKTSSKEML